MAAQAISLLVFYRKTDAHIEVWRVLHMERDIPAWLREET